MGEGLDDLGLVDAIVVDEAETEKLGPVQVGPGEIRLVAYEALVGAPYCRAPGTRSPAAAAVRLRGRQSDGLPGAHASCRGLANSFFLTANTGVVAVLGSQDVRWYLAAAGVFVAVTWWALLKSYRDLNTAKFGIILAMEERLPVRVYGDEWSRLRTEPVRFSLRRDRLRSWVAQYRELGRVERVVPWIFALIYLAEILRQLPA